MPFYHPKSSSWRAYRTGSIVSTVCLRGRLLASFQWLLHLTYGLASIPPGGESRISTISVRFVYPFSPNASSSWPIVIQKTSRSTVGDIHQQQACLVSIRSARSTTTSYGRSFSSESALKQRDLGLRGPKHKPHLSKKDNKGGWPCCTVRRGNPGPDSILRMVPYPSLSSQVAIVFPVGVIASVNLIIAGLVVTCALRAVISLKIKKKKKNKLEYRRIGVIWCWLSSTWRPCHVYNEPFWGSHLQVDPPLQDSPGLYYQMPIPLNPVFPHDQCLHFGDFGRLVLKEVP